LTTPPPSGDGDGEANEATTEFPMTYIIIIAAGGVCCCLITCVWVWWRHKKRSERRESFTPIDNSRDFSNGASNSAANPPAFRRDSWITNDRSPGGGLGERGGPRPGASTGHVAYTASIKHPKTESWLDKYRYPEASPSDDRPGSGDGSQPISFQNESPQSRNYRKERERKERGQEIEMRRMQGNEHVGYLDAEVIPGSVASRRESDSASNNRPTSIVDAPDMPNANDSDLVSVLRKKLTSGQIDRDEYEKMRAVMLRQQAMEEDDDYNVGITSV